MIRIETTAEFDAEGRFTASGQTSSAVAPGSHPIVILVKDFTESTSQSDRSADQSTVLVREGPLLLIDAEALPNADFDIRAMIKADREERTAHILGSGLP